MSTKSIVDHVRDCCCILNIGADPRPPSPPKLRSVDLKVKLPITDTVSRFYAPQRNRKGIRVLTVAVYILCVSMAAIILSIYYIFVWDPDQKPQIQTTKNCDKIVIPEFIAIRLINSTEISAEQFYKNLAEFYNQFVSNKTIASTRKSRTSPSSELQLLSPLYSYSHRSSKHKKYSRVAVIKTTAPPIMTTTPRTIPMLQTYQRKYLKRINKEDKDDDDAWTFQNFDNNDKLQYFDSDSTENVYTDESYDTTNYETYS